VGLQWHIGPGGCSSALGQGSSGGGGCWRGLSGTTVAVRWCGTSLRMRVHRLVHIHGSSHSGWGSSSDSCIGAGRSGVVLTPTSWEVGGASVSMGVEEVSFIHLETGVLAFGVWEPAKKFRRLPSQLEGPGFWPGPMVEGRAQPVRVEVVCWGQERVWIKIRGRVVVL